MALGTEPNRGSGLDPFYAAGHPFGPGSQVLGTERQWPVQRPKWCSGSPSPPAAKCCPPLPLHSHSLPQPPLAQYGAQGVSAGNDFTCALSSAGVSCWGSSACNCVGNHTHFFLNYTAVASGSYHVCALLSTGETECWGVIGELGSPPGSNDFVSISSGDAFVCGVTPTSAGNDAVCWGRSTSGQLGAPDDEFSGVSAGVNHVLTSKSILISSQCTHSCSIHGRCVHRFAA